MTDTSGRFLFSLVWFLPVIFSECVFLLIFFNEDLRDRFRRFFAASGQPLLYDGGNTGREEFHMVVDMGDVFEIGSCNVEGGAVFQEYILEIEAEFEIQTVEDLVVFDVAEEFEKVKAVFFTFNLIIENIQKLRHYTLIDRIDQIIHIHVVGIEGRTVDSGFLADI